LERKYPESPAKIGLPVIERYRTELLIHRLEELGIANVQAGELRRADLGEVLGELEAGSDVRNLSRLHCVIAPLWVAAFGAVHCGLCQPGFDGEYGFGSRGGHIRFVSCQLKHLLHVLLVLLPGLQRLCIILDVVVAVG
jgi:hypothetical protein